MYCIVTDLTRPRPGVIMVHYELRDADDSVLEAGTFGFNVTAYDASGQPVSETALQKRARLKAEADAYFARILNDAALVDEHFDVLRGQAAGYRYPNAG